MNFIIRNLSLITVSLLIVFISLPGRLLAQDTTSVVHLASVQVTGERISPFAIGTHTTTFDSSLLKLSGSITLSDFLDNYSAITLKSYGNGMLSNISIRGTGANHTAVLWHGINISYPMLGQSDLSVLSLALSDKVSIQYGNSSALYGTGAIGGTISLENYEPEEGIDLTFDQGFGSFGTLNSKLNSSIRTKKYFIKWNAVWDRSENDFAFKNTTKVGTPYEKQNWARYNVGGTSIEAGIFINEHAMLRFSGQYLNANRNLQPNMNVNAPGDQQKDENLRLRVGYSLNQENYDWEIKYAYLNDVIGFNNDQTSSNQHVIRGKFNHQLSKKIKLNLGADYNTIQVKAPFYTRDIIEEIRTNIWSALLINPIPRLILSVNLRQAFNPDYKIPFTTSIGAEYMVFDTPTHQVIINGSIGEGFRLPTLNERFWQPGGNPEISPEDSYSAEIGLQGKIKNDHEVSYSISAYRMWVDNWILWVPDGIYWSPVNIKEVEAYGIEVSGHFQHDIPWGNIRWNANYALNRSTNQTGIDSFDRSVGKQLAYVPIHKASFTSITHVKRWFLLANASITSKRYVTADNEESLPGFALINVRLGKNIKLSQYIIGGHISVNNLLNTQYQSVANKAMPGVNFMAGITINYHKL